MSGAFVFAVAAEHRPQMGRDEIDRILRDAIEDALPTTPHRESLLLAMYDAIELKPGALGISIDLKRILEHLIPDIRERLSDIRFDRGSMHSLRFLVTPSACRSVVGIDMAREQLGESQLQLLLAAGLIRKETRSDIEVVELTHDRLVKVILES